MRKKKKMTETELLAVLDMSEDEQKQAILDLLDEETMEWFVDYDMHLADLAFRLRDEVCKEINGCEKYHNGLEAIYVHKCIKKQCRSFYAWLTYQLEKIDMVIAALIAKDKEDENHS